MQLRRGFTVLAVAGAIATTTAAPALADPHPSEGVITAVCDGTTYSVTTNGGQNVDKDVFTPAHDINTSSVFVPTEFGGFSGTISQGSTELFSFSDDNVSTKGNAHPNGHEILDCSYTFSDNFVAGPQDVDESGGVLVEGQTYRFTGNGEVSGFFTGKKS